MKFKNNTKLNTVAAYAIIVIAIALLYALLIFNLGSVFAAFKWLLGKLKCVLYAFFFAFISIPPMRFFDRILSKHVFKTRRRQPLVRTLSAILTMLLIVIVLLILILAIVPSLQTSFVELQGAIGPAIEDTRTWIEKNVKESEILLPIYESLTAFLSEQILSTSDSGSIFSLLLGYVQNIANELSAIFLGLVLGLYSLLFRRKITSILSKILSAILPNKLNTVAYKGVRRTYFYFMEYFAVRVISAIYLALLSFLFCLIFHIPFRSLIAILVFVFNLIPQFGGLLITIILPLAFLILDRSYALPLLLILLVLHSFHMFAVEPFFLRKRLRPNLGLTITITLVFGAIFGFVGFLFAVPMYASIHAIFQNMEMKRLIKRGLPVGDDYYLHLSNLPEGDDFADDLSASEEADGENSIKVPNAPIASLEE